MSLFNISNVFKNLNLDVFYIYVFFIHMPVIPVNKEGNGWKKTIMLYSRFAEIPCVRSNVSFFRLTI